VVAQPSTEIGVFVSYAWESEEHRNWVKLFVDELRKHGVSATADYKDVRPGEQLTSFMERGMTESDVTILICSSTYTEKANARAPGGVGYESVLCAHEYLIRTPEQRARFIPVVRNNAMPAARKLPKYLGSARYIDMSGSDWRSSPMLTIVDEIRRLTPDPV
jgi:hypothetical protein